MKYKNELKEWSREKREEGGKGDNLLKNSDAIFPLGRKEMEGRKWEENTVKRHLDTMEMGAA